MNSEEDSTTQLTLQQPTMALATSFAAMRDAFLETGDDRWVERYAVAHRDIEAYLRLLSDEAQGKNLPTGWVAAETFWVTQKANVVGSVTLRYGMTPHINETGGNIGYLTHPKHRNRGVATFALRASLDIFRQREQGIVILTCLDTNTASAGIIEKCGGTRLADSVVGGIRRRRYIFQVRSLQFETKTCLLRAGKAEDVESIARHANEIEIWQNLRDFFPHPYSTADAEQWLAHMGKAVPQTNFIIDIHGEAIGGASLHIQSNIDHASALIGYWLGKAFWGRGIATDAARALVRYGFETLGLTRIQTPVFAHNVRSCQVLQKAGFQQEGFLRKGAIKNGKIIDIILFGIVR